VGAEELRGYLAGKLPDYMVPAVYVRLESFAANAQWEGGPEGIGRRRRGMHTRFGRYEAPQGEIETIVAEIWAELLKVERVGRQDNFFCIGGHSLLVGADHRTATESLGVEVRVDALFARPVLSDFARGVESSRNGGVLATMRADGTEYLPTVNSRSRRRGHSGCEHCAAFPNAGGYACRERILDRGFRNFWVVSCWRSY